MRQPDQEGCRHRLGLHAHRQHLTEEGLTLGRRMQIREISQRLLELRRERSHRMRAIAAH